MAKDLQQIKEEVATELGYKSNSVFSAYEQLLINPHGLNYKVISNCINQIAIRYAQEQNKELLCVLGRVVKDIDNTENPCLEITGETLVLIEQLINKHKKEGNYE